MRTSQIGSCLSNLRALLTAASLLVLCLPGLAQTKLTPASLSFGSVALGASKGPNTATFKNLQKTPVTISNIGISGGNAPGDYTLGGNCPISPSTLGAGTSCTITVTFTPAALGNRISSLTVTSSSSSSPQSVALAGVGIAPVTVTPASLTFAGTLVGTTSAPKTVTLTNHLATALAMSSVTTSGNFAVSSNGCGSSVAAGHACTIGVTFTPASIGALTGQLSLNYQAFGSPTLVALSGTGTDKGLTSITVTPANPSIAAGNTLQFSATGHFKGGSTESLTSYVAWSSSNTSVATIAPSGLATGVTAGTSGISAALGGISGSTTLTVTPPTLVSIAVTPTNPSIPKGTTQQFTAIGTYSNSSTQNLTSSVTWASSNNSIASVAAGGLATGVGTGMCNITAALGSVVSPGDTLTITSPVLISIAVSPTNPSISKGTAQQFAATGTYGDGTTQNITASVTWASSNASVATIAVGGLATGVGLGTSNITASLSNIISPSDALTVTPPTLVSIAVTPANPSIAKGTTQQFTATGTYTDGSTQNLTATVAWASSNHSTATIATGGLATGAGAGTSNITATLNSVVSPADMLTVTAATLVSIAVTPVNPSIAAGTTQQFTATGTYSDASTQNITTSVMWGSSNLSMATITAGGLATGVATGTSNITATLGNIVSPVDTLTVTPAILVSIAVTPANPAIAKGLTEQFAATGTYSDGSLSDLTASASWGSSNPAVASISASGLASSVATGSTTVVASVNSISGSTLLTVNPAALTSISVTPATVWVAVGSNTQYTATGTFSDGSTANLTNAVAWSSSNPLLATVISTGLATSTGGGAAIITATQGTASGSATMNGIPNGYVTCDAHVVDMRVLVVTNGQSESDFPAIAQALGYIGTPYSVLDISQTGNMIPSGSLSDGACHGYFQGVIFGFGNNIYTISNNSDLFSYESQFNVRQVNWYVYPDPNFGLASPTGSIDASPSPYNFSYAPAATAIFPYANVANPVGITNAFIYLSSVVNGATPLLTDDSGNVLGAVYNTGFAGQYLSLTFDSNPYLLHDQVLAYGLVNWVTQGIFLGDYHVYASPQVDDFFIDDSEWIPGTTCQAPITHDRTKPDASNLPVFRVNALDMTQLTAWQSGIQADPSGLFANFQLTMAFNGVGTAGNGDWTGLAAPVTATSANNDLVTFTTTDFSGQPGAQVNVTGTTNDGGALNGTRTILSVASDSSTTPATTQFTATVTGAGTVAQQTETGATAAVADDLVANLQSYQGAFHWISHTFDHPNTLNNLSKSTPSGNGDDIDLEVLTNLWVASNPNGVKLDNDPSDSALAQLIFSDFNPANMVTPGVTGLNDPNVPGYLNADGIQYVVTDTSIIGQPNNGPNPSPNVGIVNSYAPLLYEVPRHPNDIYFNAANWNDDQAEFDCIYSYPTQQPPFNAYTAAQILNFVSSSFLSNMLIGDMDPEMFHQPDLHFSINTAPGMPTFGQTSSLLTDTYDQTFSLYKQVYNLPVLSPTLDQLGQAMQNRNAYNLSGITGSIIGGSNPAISITMPSTTVPSATIPITGLNSTGAEVYGGQYISYVPIGAGQTITMPLP